MSGDPKSEDYLTACYDAWMTVFDSYDQLLRMFRSMSPNLGEDMLRNLNELKRHIEDKRMQVEQILEESLYRVRNDGVNVQETQPLAAKIDFSVAKCLKAAWPTCQPTPQPAPTQEHEENRTPSAFETASSSIAPLPPAPPQKEVPDPASVTVTTTSVGPPPGFDRIVSWVQTVDSKPPPKKPDSKPVPVANDDDDFDDFDVVPVGEPVSTFGTKIEEPKKVNKSKPHILNDFDDFEPFGEDVGYRPVSAPVPSAARPAQPLGQQLRLPNGDASNIWETMRCVDYLTNKIKQKYGDKNDAALSKVYGHLSEEKAYRMLIGGLKEFPDFLTRFPEYFVLSADQQMVRLAPNAVKKSLEAVKLAKRLADEAAKHRSKQRKPSESSSRGLAPRPPSPMKIIKPAKPVVNPNKPQIPAKKSNLMELDDYGCGSSSDDAARLSDLSIGDSDDDSSSVDYRKQTLTNTKENQVLKSYNKK